jgi:nucleoside-diphosphate-sugar epimerase
MRVFVAGASGAIGTPLVRRLVAAGHRVIGATRRPERADGLRAAGAEPAVVDAFDAAALRDVVIEAKPEVVINQLTSLPQDFNPRKLDYGPTNRVRSVGGHNLIEAARAAGARRFVTQSIAFLYAPEGEWVKDEDGRPFTNAPGAFASGVEAMIGHEREALDADGLESLVLRYGWFYGPGTYYASDGSLAEQVRKRRFPIVGGGEGITSFLHIEDAAAATVVALDHGGGGIYNVVDDEPAMLRDWLPVYAAALGAKPPRRFPVWLARLVGGPMVGLLSSLRGASNAKAKGELGWQPIYPSWREGFHRALG